MSFASIPDVIEALRRGQMIVLMDDFDRENEGDLVCAAEFITPQIVNFMLKEARGVLCVAMTAENCDRLQLYPQASQNTAPLGTAFTISVDAHQRFGITTGVSASERATTIKLMSDASSKPGDLCRPGHIFPLRARPGGVLAGTRRRSWISVGGGPPDPLGSRSLVAGTAGGNHHLGQSLQSGRGL